LIDPQPCLLYELPQTPYIAALNWQRSLLQARKETPSLDDILILLEHPPVYTLGQGAATDFLKFDPAQTSAELHRVERGGEVTYHCPGQLVGYPVLNLQRHTPDLHWYLRQLEEVVIQAIAPFGLQGDRIPGLTGVWVDGHKVAAVGIKVSRWITMHGFALNVNPDLSGFQAIVPCGIADRPVGSLAQFVPEISREAVQEQVKLAFSHVFTLSLIPASLSDERPTPV
jgi:lipoyl(octanoyl) transferase